MEEIDEEMPTYIDLGQCSLKCDYDTGLVTMHLDPEEARFMSRQQKRELERRAYKMALKCAEGLCIKVQKGWVNP